MNPLRARYAILLGHAQDTENYVFQKLLRVRGRSAKKICNISGEQFPHKCFGIWNIFLRRQYPMAEHDYKHISLEVHIWESLWSMRLQERKELCGEAQDLVKNSLSDIALETLSALSSGSKKP